MKNNQINVYDLEAVNTDIVLREIPYNPDTICIIVRDLQPTTTDIVLYPIQCIQASGGGGSTLTLDLSDSISLSDAIASAFGKNLSDSGTLSDAVAKGIGLNPSDTFTLSDAAIKAFGLSLTDVITLSDNFSIFVPTTGGTVFTGRIRGESKMSKLVREYLRDTVLSIRDDISFTYARESDFNAIKGKRFPAVLLLPFEFSIDRPIQAINRKYRITMLFYDLDKTQGAEKQTQDILDRTDELLQKFSMLVDQSVTEDDPETIVSSEKIVISNESVTPRVKFTTDCVTGWEYSFDLEVPDQNDYCNVYVY